MKPNIYIFFREDGFYPIEMPREMLEKHGEAKCIADNAILNKGTLKVEDIHGKVIWQLPEAQ